jgi:hypothetical protein
MKPESKKTSWLPARKDKRYWKRLSRKAARAAGKRQDGGA